MSKLTNPKHITLKVKQFIRKDAPGPYQKINFQILSSFGMFVRIEFKKLEFNFDAQQNLSDTRYIGRQN